jgi:hypothetical protein
MSSSLADIVNWIKNRLRVLFSLMYNSIIANKLVNYIKVFVGDRRVKMCVKVLVGYTLFCLLVELGKRYLIWKH